MIKMAMSGLTFTCFPTISTAMVFAADVVAGQGEMDEEEEGEKWKGKIIN